MNNKIAPDHSRLHLLWVYIPYILHSYRWNTGISAIYTQKKEGGKPFFVSQNISHKNYGNWI